MNRNLLSDWRTPIALFIGWILIVALIAVTEGQWDEARFFILISSLMIIPSAISYRYGRMSRNEEVDFWIDSALLNEPEANRTIFSNTHSEDELRRRIEVALNRRGSR